jgi:hypothetical protein
MCLAIMKPKGKPILEEYLHNGWLNNDDGAGFCYIDENKQFVIHKSMTYEGFIDVYKEAVERYGNISDFLIHFRIASKGKTTIDNCHPFIVDKDRVIIHNGTLYNIAIDKGDGRSDTKVFAEDWLSQLPADWEDNKILHLMVEDFISSGSKICMLHRTKGIYIYNEDRGLWTDGVWYSNKSYEKHITHNFNSMVTTTFYSFKWGRMVTLEESKKMTQQETYEHRNWDLIRKGDKKLTANNSIIGNWIQCDLCKDYDISDNMIDMMGDHANQQWCWDCYKDAEPCDSCGKTFAEKDTDDYYNPESGEMVLLCDTCVPYLNCIEVEKVATPPELKDDDVPFKEDTKQVA